MTTPDGQPESRDEAVALLAERERILAEVPKVQAEAQFLRGWIASHDQIAGNVAALTDGPKPAPKRSPRKRAPAKKPARKRR